MSAKDSRSHCDACLRSKTETESTHYCINCQKKLCRKHWQFHNEAIGWDHEVLSIDNYKQQAARLQTRMCSDHKTSPLTMGCKSCKMVCCSVCVANSQVTTRTCLYGQVHQFDTLDSLEVVSLQNLKDSVQEMKKIKESVMEKREGVNKARSAIDENAGKMLHLLEARKLEQTNGIEKLYDEQKKRLTTVVDNQLGQLSAYTSDVDRLVTQIESMVTKVETEVPQYHAADVVAEEKSVKQQLVNLQRNPLQEPDLPKILFQDLGHSRTRICELIVTESAVNSRKPIKMLSSGNLHTPR